MVALWIGVVVFIMFLSGELESATWYERLGVGALVLAPGYLAFGAAWVVEGFAQAKRSE